MTVNTLLAVGALLTIATLYIKARFYWRELKKKHETQKRLDGYRDRIFELEFQVSELKRRTKKGRK